MVTPSNLTLSVRGIVILLISRVSYRHSKTRILFLSHSCLIGAILLSVFRN